MRFILNEQPGQDDIMNVRSKLLEYNRPFFGNEKDQAFVMEAMSEEGELAGGIVFIIGSGWLKVDLLWVHERERGKRLGTELLMKAEETAKSRGCGMAYLTTFSFQARPFYEKHGYKLVYTQRSFPAGIVKYHMEKSLT